MTFFWPRLNTENSEIQDHRAHVDCWINQQQLAFRSSINYRSMNIRKGIPAEVRVGKNGSLAWRKLGQKAGPNTNEHPEGRHLRRLENEQLANINKAKRIFDLSERRKSSKLITKSNWDKNRQKVLELASRPEYQSKKSGMASVIAKLLGITPRQVRRYLAEKKNGHSLKIAIYR